MYVFYGIKNLKKNVQHLHIQYNTNNNNDDKTSENFLPVKQMLLVLYRYTDCVVRTHTYICMYIDNIMLLRTYELRNRNGNNIFLSLSLSPNLRVRVRRRRDVWRGSVIIIIVSEIISWNLQKENTTFRVRVTLW